MDKYTIAEVSYNNGYGKGYKDGVTDFVKYLKAHSFLCNKDNIVSFKAINEADLDDFVECFLK